MAADDRTSASQRGLAMAQIIGEAQVASAAVTTEDWAA